MKIFELKLVKKTGAVVAVAIGMTASSSAQAASFNATGRVNNVAIFDQTQVQMPSTFTLVGVSSLGSCGTLFGFVLLRLKDDLHGQRMYAAVLAAAASGSQLSVNVEDTYRDSAGFCYVTNLSFSGN
jgi:hypothetical protein